MVSKSAETAMRRVKYSDKRKTFFIGLTYSGLYVLRDNNGKEVSPELSNLKTMFRWCRLNKYAIYNKNPMRRKYVGNR